MLLFLACFMLPDSRERIRRMIRSIPEIEEGLDGQQKKEFQVKQEKAAADARKAYETLSDYQKKQVGDEHLRKLLHILLCPERQIQEG